MFIAVLGYHALGIYAGESTAIIRAWWNARRTVVLSENRRGETLWSWPVISFAGFHSNLSTPADRRLAEWGQRAKYEVGNRPARYAEASTDGTRWFFLRDEFAFQFPAQASVARESVQDLGREIIETFESRGARVLFLPIPTKVSVLRDLLPKNLGPSHPLHSRVRKTEGENSAAVYQAVVSLFPERTVNLLETFSGYRRQNPQAVLYGPSDTRWSALAAAIAAQQTIDFLSPRKPASLSPQFREVPGQGELSEELMADLLQLPTHYLRARFPQLERREPVYSFSGPSSSPERSVILLGTCDGARLKETGYGLGPLLAQAMGRTLFDYSRPGEKTIPSFAELVERKTPIRPGDLVVWQFNIREVFAQDEKEKIRGYLKQIRDLNPTSPLPKS